MYGFQHVIHISVPFAWILKPFVPHFVDQVNWFIQQQQQQKTRRNYKRFRNKRKYKKQFIIAIPIGFFFLLLFFLQNVFLSCKQRNDLVEQTQGRQETHLRWIRTQYNKWCENEILFSVCLCVCVYRRARLHTNTHPNAMRREREKEKERKKKR